MDIITFILVLITGAVMGSFACCQVWRMRYRQTGKPSLGRWSVCLSCGHRLKWYDNLPIISWLLLRGKCRQCGHKIGAMEILSELGLMAIYALIYLHFAPSLGLHDSIINGQALAQMLTLLVMMIGLWILLLYDARWGEMPASVLYFCIGMGILYRAFAGVDSWISLLASVAILAGLYLALYLASHEQLMGSGDWLVCLAIALVLGNWWLALIELFLANALGSIIMLPVALKTKKHKIHFAPFLIFGFLIVFLLSDFLKSLLIAS